MSRTKSILFKKLSRLFFHPPFSRKVASLGKYDIYDDKTQKIVALYKKYGYKSDFGKFIANTPWQIWSQKEWILSIPHEFYEDIHFRRDSPKDECSVHIEYLTETHNISKIAIYFENGKIVRAIQGDKIIEGKDLSSLKRPLFKSVVKCQRT